MITLEAENVVRRLPRGRILPAMITSELENRAAVGADQAYIPVVRPANLLRERQRHSPTVHWRGTGVGDAHVQLEEGASSVGSYCRTGVSE